MTLFRNKENTVFFAHIPKTGGSSVEHALRAGGAKRALHFHKRLDFVKCTMQHMHAELYDVFIPKGFYDYGFAVVRHPFDRLESEYRWRVNLKQAKHEFNKWAIANLKRQLTKPYALDNHIRPQHEFVGKSAVEVFRFEDGLDKPISQAARKLNIEADVATHRRKGPSLDVKWTAATRDYAYEFYKQDFVQFGYDLNGHSS